MKYQQSTPGEWLRQRKRLVLYLLSFIVVVGVQTVLYWWGMRALEGDPRSLLESLEIVIQSLTTTGYGQDVPWESTFVIALAMVMQFTGIAYLFVALPVFIIPWIRDAIGETIVPEAIDDVEDHVILDQYSSLYTTLIEDLEAREQPAVIVEADEERAAELYEDDKNVVLGDPTVTETLQNVFVENAHAIVIDARQDSGVETVLSIREVDQDVTIICLIEEPSQSQYMRFAGATTVLSPKHRLGKALADKAQNVISTELESDEETDIEITITEFPVDRESGIYGRSLTQIDGIRKTGANLVAAWVRGEFVTSFTREDYIDETTVLVVAGTERQLERVQQITQKEGMVPTRGPVIIAGHGPVGTTAEGILRKAGRQTTVISSERDDGTDVIGDTTTPETFHEAGIDDAAAVLITIPDDERAILATLVARECNPSVDILVAVATVENAGKLYSAGADYVLSLPKLAGRMTTLELFEDGVMTLHEQIRMAELNAPALAGEHPDNDEIRETTDAVIVAVRRDGNVLTTFDGEFELDDEDSVIVAGPDRGVNEFQEAYAS